MGGSTTTIPAASFLKRPELEAALEEILASPSFRASLQCQNLLRYIVAHTLAGEEAMLRERVVGHQVFGRPPAYEPGEDPVVRIRAADVRKRLATYYQSRTTVPKVRVEIPAGSYRAVFTFAEDLEAQTPETGHAIQTAEPTAATLLQPAAVPVESAEAQPEMQNRSSWRVWKWAVPALLLLLFAAYSLYTTLAGRDQRALLMMWGPFLTRRSPVLLSVGSNAVYRVSEPVADAYSQAHHLQGSGMEFFPDFSPQQTLASTGLQPAPASFVAEGDVSAVAEIVTVLTSLHQPVQERFTNNTSYAEVQSNPSVLIGGFNNPMSMEFTRNLRFTLTSRTQIEDHRGTGKTWVLSAPSDARDTQDYAVVTRLVSGKEEAPVLEVAGLGQYGTLAAMRFVCNPDAIRSLSKVAGPDWMRHNLQLVLRIRVVDYRPATTEVIAHDMW